MPRKGNVSAFSADVYEAVKKIPKGTVATYAQIAFMSGHKGAARAVGNALHKNPFYGEVPCHRVVSASGSLAKHFGFGGWKVQAQMLEKEGVKSSDGIVDLEIYQYIGEADY